MPRGKKTRDQALKEANKSGRKVIWSNAVGVWHCATDIHNTPYWSTEAIDVATGSPYRIQNGLWVLS